MAFENEVRGRAITPVVPRNLGAAFLLTNAISDIRGGTTKNQYFVSQIASGHTGNIQRKRDIVGSKRLNQGEMLHVDLGLRYQRIGAIIF